MVDVGVDGNEDLASERGLMLQVRQSAAAEHARSQQSGTSITVVV